jgi:succinyl-CoA synthetase alpha subunit
MSILVNRTSRILIQGMTGRLGSSYTHMMAAYGRNVVGGVTPGKGGEWFEGLPVFDTVVRAVEATEANVSVVMVPAPAAPDAILEAADAGIPLVVCITENIPQRETMRLLYHLSTTQTRLIGPNCPGLLTPEQVSAGIIPPIVAHAGHIGVVSRSSLLLYETCYQLSQRGLGQSTIIGIGGDPMLGTDLHDVLEMFEQDPVTETIVMIGEIGGSSEIQAANYIKQHMTKPVVAYIAGEYAPRDQMLGHAGAIVTADEGDAQSKQQALQEAGALIAHTPDEIAPLLQQLSAS